MTLIKAYWYEVLRAPDPAELGERVELEPRRFDPSAYDVRESCVQVELLPDVEVGESGSGEPRLYRRHVPYGRSLAHALGEGWCRVIDLPRGNGEPAGDRVCPVEGQA